MKKAVFIDRDGTLIEDRGHLKSPKEVVFYKNAIEALYNLQDSYELFIITNQSGVAKGLISLSEVESVNAHITDVLNQQGIRIKNIYVCPHQKEDACECIKPKPYFLEKAAAKYDIDLSTSFSIGDHPCDLQLAQNAGGKGIYVLTGHGERHLSELCENALVVQDIKAAADTILSNIQPNISDDLKHAAQLIKNGSVVAFPTETVYGLGANALDGQASAEIFEIKERPHFDPLIVHIASLKEARQLALNFPAKAEKLVKKFWPGPLTIVVYKSESIPDIVTSGLPTVGIRMPANRMALELIQQAGVPIAAPSANLFGSISPTCAEHVQAQLGEKVEFILNGGPCSVGIESTIISFAEDCPTILRFGGITLEQIESVIGKVNVSDHTDKKPLSPGRLEHHYAPRTPMFLLDSLKIPPEDKRVGLLIFTTKQRHPEFDTVEILSVTGNLSEAAKNLFAAMRRLDSMSLDMIYAVKVPDQKIGIAINDRLYRASQKIQI